MASTITLASVLNFCSTHIELLPLTGVGGIANEPGLSIGNDAIAEIINEEQDWKWNRVELSPVVQPLITATNKQDYLWAGATAFCLAANPSGMTPAVQSSGAAIALASNSAISVVSGVVTVNTLEPHRFQVGYTVYLLGVKMTLGTASVYNATYADNGNETSWGNGFTITAITANSFSFDAVSGMNNTDVGGAPGITNWGWLTGAQMMELNNNSSPPNYRQLKARRELPRWSKCADPEFVSMIQDLGTGVLKFRFQYVPAADIWAVGLVYQAAAPLMMSITSTFAPIPDMFGSMIRQAVLYRCFRYMSSSSAAAANRADVEYQKLQQAIGKAQGRDQAEEGNVYLEPEESLIDMPGPYYIGF
jgi:hypothetical protein